MYKTSDLENNIFISIIIMIASIKTKLKYEVGMAVPKSTCTQIRFVGITYHIHYIIHVYACRCGVYIYYDCLPCATIRFGTRMCWWIGSWVSGRCQSLETEGLRGQLAG